MAQPTYEQLLDLLAQKDRRIAELEAQLRTQEARIRELEALLERAIRGTKRQAAPFSKGEPKKDPKPPGRKSGSDYGPKAHRPLPEQKPDQIINVPLPPTCPQCHGPVTEDRVDQQFQVEIPRRPILRRFDIHIGCCRCCGCRIQPRHPLQTSDALGAAASQLGPDLQALIALMKDQYGLSYGDIQGLLDQTFGISVSRGGAAQVVLRAGNHAEPVYDCLCTLVRYGDPVYPDETGWKVAGLLQWLWVFVTGLATVYCIRPSRGRDVPQEVLGIDYAGRMIHDGWSPYDAFVKAIHQQCLQHLLGRAEELLERASRGAVRFPRKIRRLLRKALALRDRRDAGTISAAGLAVVRGRLEKQLDRLLNGKLAHAANRKFQAHLARHQDEILTFLYQPDIEATNWPAEQAIRPAVVNRKVFGGNRTPAGAHAQEILASVFATCAQHARDALAFLSNMIRMPPDSNIPFLKQLLPAPAG